MSFRKETGRDTGTYGKAKHNLLKHIFFSENNRVFVWGYGILGFGPNVQKVTTPTEIPQILFGQNMYMTDSKVVSITSGLYHMAAVTNYGHLFMWGHNKGGCLG